jgi:hypothetical protein
MAMERGTWKKVGYGILAAGVGAAIFGAAHFYFLGNVPAGNILGISYNVLFPFILGTLGFIGAYGFTKEGNLRNVLLFGSAAAIGFGVAEFAGWATFSKGSITGGSARASAAYIPPRVATPMPNMGYTASPMGSSGSLVIGGGAYAKTKVI